MKEDIENLRKLSAENANDYTKSTVDKIIESCYREAKAGYWSYELEKHERSHEITMLLRIEGFKVENNTVSWEP